jgi:hypothetical protein
MRATAAKALDHTVPQRSRSAAEVRDLGEEAGELYGLESCASSSSDQGAYGEFMAALARGTGP